MKTSRFFTLFITILAVLTLAACSSSSTGGPEGEDGMGGYGDGLSESDLNAQREARYGSGAIPFAEGEGVFRDIPFNYDSATLSDTARQNAEYNIEILKANPEVSVQLEGHCDERGTAEYNMALGNRRAQSVYELLASHGVPRERIETISYGSEVPLDPAHNESAYAKNRRVHFSAFREVPR